MSRDFVVPNNVPTMEQLKKLLSMKTEAKYKAIQKVLNRMHKVETKENIEKASNLIDRRIADGRMTNDFKDIPQ